MPAARRACWPSPMPRRPAAGRVETGHCTAVVLGGVRNSASAVELDVVVPVCTTMLPAVVPGRRGRRRCVRRGDARSAHAGDHRAGCSCSTRRCSPSASIVAFDAVQVKSAGGFRARWASISTDTVVVGSRGEHRRTHPCPTGWYKPTAGGGLSGAERRSVLGASWPSSEGGATSRRPAPCLLERLDGVSCSGRTAGCATPNATASDSVAGTLRSGGHAGPAAIRRALQVDCGHRQSVSASAVLRQPASSCCRRISVICSGVAAGRRGRQ